MSWWLAILPFPTGLVLTTFDERFTSPAWRFAGGFPGGYAMWGGSLIVFGIFMQLTMVGKT